MHLVVRRIVRLYLFVGQRDLLSRTLFVVDDHLLDILSRVDSEVLVPSPLQRRHALLVLRVPFQRLGDTIPFDELLDRLRSSVEALDRVLKTVEYGVWRSTRVEPFETVPLDVFDERRGRALRHERHPVVVGLVFEPNLDAFRDLRRERPDGLAVIVVDVGVRSHPDGVDDAVDDPPAAGLQPLFRRQNDDIVEYLRDLADVVDNEKSVNEVEEKWESREVDISV